MILESFKYIRHKGFPNEWSLCGKDGNSVQFANTNLIVGKNAAGKSRTLSLIAEAASVLGLKRNLSDIKIHTYSYDLGFKRGGDLYKYFVSVQNDCVLDEVLTINGEDKFNRIERKIYSEAEKTYNEINVSDNEVVVSIHENKEEYPYLSELYKWGNALKRFTFTNQYEKSHLLSIDELENLTNNHNVDLESVIHLFYNGKKLFGDDFSKAVISDMKHLDYSLNDIYLDYSKGGVGISVSEDELIDSTSQTEMSQGMFRALAFIIQLNIALLSNVSLCMLIDDLGEGLDFSRSKSLVDLLIYKINNSNIQLFITSNDRYIMNTVPIKYWSVLERDPQSSYFYNYFNTQQNFEDFKYTGLSNFDFLTTGFYRYGFENNEQDT